MAFYEYKGQHYELSDDLSPAQAKAKIQSYLGESASTPVQNNDTSIPPTLPVVEVTGGVNSPEQPQQQPVDTINQEPSVFQRTLGLGSPAFRVLKGAIIDPLVGTGQLANNVGGNGMVVNPLFASGQLLSRAGLFGDIVKQNADVNSNVAELARRVDEARKAQGSEGFDWWQLAGNVTSPTNKIAGNMINREAGMFAKAGQGALAGGAMAAMQPVASDDFEMAKGVQTAVGSILGGGLQATFSAVGKLGDMARAFTENGKKEALQEYLNKLTGGAKEQVIKALQDAKELVTGSRPTAAEAISDIPTAAEIAVAQRKLAKTEGFIGKFAERSAEQQAARARTLQGISGTADDRAAAELARANATKPLREKSIKVADGVSRIGTKLEKDAKEALSKTYTVPTFAANAEGRKQALLQLKDRRELQLATLKQNGFFPLKADDLLGNLNSALKASTDDQARTVLKGFIKKVEEKVDSDGIISSHELYQNVRKPSNQEIARWLGMENYADGGIPKMAAGAAQSAKQLIDASLNKSTNGLWGQYLKTYTQHSEKLNRMEVGDYLARKLNSNLDKETLGKFAAAVDNAAATLKNSTGNPRFERLDQVLTKNEVAAVNNVLADLARTDKAARMGRLGESKLEVQPSVTAGTPVLLDKTVTIIRSVLANLQKGNIERFNKELAELMLNPAEMAKVMTTTVPKSRITEFTNAMFKYMTPENRNVFVQSFTIPPTANALGE